MLLVEQKRCTIFWNLLSWIQRNMRQWNLLIHNAKFGEIFRMHHHLDRRSSQDLLEGTPCYMWEKISAFQTGNSHMWHDYGSLCPMRAFWFPFLGKHEKYDQRHEHTTSDWRLCKIMVPQRTTYRQEQFFLSILYGHFRDHCLGKSCVTHKFQTNILHVMYIKYKYVYNLR